jgi:Fungal specific transcription factor domain
VYKKPAEGGITQSRALSYREIQLSRVLAHGHQLLKTISAESLIHRQLLASAFGMKRAEVPRRHSLWHIAHTILNECADSPNALHAAPLAWYMAWIGRRDQAPQLQEGSRHLYLRGLREVVQALHRDKTALKDETLAACISLVLYETIECPERCAKGYNTHVHGCLTLIEKRGPGAHQDGAAHRLFTTIRLVGVRLPYNYRGFDSQTQALDALARHRPSFLASGLWMSKPWDLHPKGPLDRVIDILLLAPKVLQTVDRLNNNPRGEALPEFIDIFEYCAQIDTELATFFTHMEDMFESPWYWEVPTSRDGDIIPPFSTGFQFCNLDCAHLMTLYWATYLLLLAGVGDLYGCLERDCLASQLDHAISPAAESLIAKRNRWYEMSNNVCRSVEYGLRAHHSGAGALRMASSLDIAIAVMKGRKESKNVLSWALKTRKQIGDRWLRLLKHEDD